MEQIPWPLQDTVEISREDPGHISVQLAPKWVPRQAEQLAVDSQKPAVEFIAQTQSPAVGRPQAP